MLNLLWLLLPVAAAGGWFAGRRSAEPSESDDFWNFASNYHQGLNYLLNEQMEDKAVDLFVTGGDVDQETADTHLALGNMFRRRGEVDRAIKIHQSLVDKSQLADSTRSDALLELAKDYDSAGLLDRSEDRFRQLIKQGTHLEAAYENLLLIHERAHDWSRAIEIATESQQHTEQNLDERVAHYYCELAEEANRENNPGLSQQMLERALVSSENCARANVLLAEMALKQNDYATAIEKFERVEQLRPELMPEIISPLFQAFSLSGDEQRLRTYINRIKSRLNSYSVIKTTRDMIEQLDGARDADQFFKDQIVKRPSLKGLRDWARGQLEKSPSGERGKVAVMCDMLDQVVKDKPGYVCSNCGFRGQTLHWRCPSCGSWDSVHTVIGAEGE